MKFKARTKDGEYLDAFYVSHTGDVIQYGSTGILEIVVDAELLPVIEVKPFCQYCGKNNAALLELAKVNVELQDKLAARGEL